MYKRQGLQPFWAVTAPVPAGSGLLGALLWEPVRVWFVSLVRVTQGREYRLFCGRGAAWVQRWTGWGLPCLVFESLSLTFHNPQFFGITLHLFQLLGIRVVLMLVKWLLT